MSIEDFKAKLNEAPRYEFQVGSVISWVMGGRYIYAAVKTETDWYATSYNDNGWIPRRMNDDQLLDVLSRPEATKIRLALTWEYLLGSEADEHEDQPQDELYVLMDDDNVNYLGWYTSVKKAKKDAADRFFTGKNEWEKNEDGNWYANDAEGTTMCIVPVVKGEQ